MWITIQNLLEIVNFACLLAPCSGKIANQSLCLLNVLDILNNFSKDSNFVSHIDHEYSLLKMLNFICILAPFSGKIANLTVCLAEAGLLKCHDRLAATLTDRVFSLSTKTKLYFMCSLYHVAMTELSRNQFQYCFAFKIAIFFLEIFGKQMCLIS